MALREVRAVVTPPPLAFSVFAARSQNRSDRCQQNPDVGKQGPISDVPKLHPATFRIADAVPTIDSPCPRYPRTNRKKHLPLAGLVQLKLLGNDWPRADEGHVADQNVPKLRELVQARAAEKLPQHRNTRVGAIRNLEVIPAIQIVKSRTFIENPFRVGSHGSQFEATETASSEADALMLKKRSSARLQSDQSGEQSNKRSDDADSRCGDRNVETPLDLGRETCATGARQLHQREIPTPHYNRIVPSKHLRRHDGKEVAVKQKREISDQTHRGTAERAGNQDGPGLMLLNRRSNQQPRAFLRIRLDVYGDN